MGVYKTILKKSSIFKNNKLAKYNNKLAREDLKTMFSVSELIKNNSTSNIRNTDKKLALEDNKDYMQISVRTQRGKQYVNAILYKNNAKPHQLNKKQALQTLLDYINGNTLKNTVYSVDKKLVDAFKDYLKNN